MNLCLYILAVAASLLFGVAVYTGLGLLVRRLMGVRDLDLDGLSEAPIIGWCVGLAALQIWHLFLPVNSAALVLTVGAGITGLLLSTRLLQRAVSAGPRRGLRGAVVAFVVMVLWLAVHTTNYPKLFDSGLYHVTNVKWVGTYPVVPGLSNLSREFGHNCAYFLYAALLDVGPFVDRFHHLASGILLASAMLRVCASGFQLFSDQAKAGPRHLFDVLFFPLLVYLTVGDYGFGSTPSPDLALYVLGVMVASMLMSLLSSDPLESNCRDPGAPRALAHRFVTVALLAGTGIAIKLSSVGLFGAVSVLIASLYCLRLRRTRKPDVLTAIGVAIVALVIFVPWTARSIVLSGYVGYPSTAIAAPVEWRVPEADAKAYIIRARAESREFTGDHERVLSDWRWLGPWLRRMMGPPFDFEVVTPLALAFVGAPLIYLLVRERGARRGPGAVGWIMLVPLFNLAYWFVMAPDPRHAGATFWFAGNGALTLALWNADVRTWRATALSVALVLVVMSVKLPDLVLEWRRNTGPIQHKQLETRTTASGLDVYVPVGDFRVWNAPLPCTPYFDPRLRERVPGGSVEGIRPGSS